jgi:hypothetical protein
MAEQVPDVGWVVCDTGQPLDDLSRALQGPQVIGVAMGFGAFGQFAFDHTKLVAVDLRQPPSAPSAT